MRQLRIDLSRIQLAALQDGRPFDGMAAGEFVDMWGRKVVFRKEDLPAYVTNTLAALAETKDSTGAIVGFPIDGLNHDHGQAAGWITNVQLGSDGARIEFIPKWTDIGIDLISRGVMRYFSPEVNVQAQVIAGGSLTNWPASRTKDEKIMLKPIVLSKAAALTGMDGAPSLNDQVYEIEESFMGLYGNFDYTTYPLDVFDGFLVCRNDDKLWRVNYTIGEAGEIQFAPQAEWVEVKRTYVEAALASFRKFINSLFSGAQPAQPAPIEAEQKPAPAEEMEVELFDLSKLTPEQRQDVLAQLTSGNAPAELAALIDRQANERVSALLAVEQRKVSTAALSARLAGGSPENPRGLPVDKAELAEFLMSLSPDQAEKATTLLSKVVEKGLIEFGELGHSGKVPTLETLPIEYAAQLEAGKMTLADLSNPVLALGDLSKYDLSKWQGKKE